MYVIQTHSEQLPGTYPIVVVTAERTYLELHKLIPEDLTESARAREMARIPTVKTLKTMAFDYRIAFSFAYGDDIEVWHCPPHMVSTVMQDMVTHLMDFYFSHQGTIGEL